MRLVQVIDRIDSVILLVGAKRHCALIRNRYVDQTYTLFLTFTYIPNRESTMT